MKCSLMAEDGKSFRQEISSGVINSGFPGTLGWQDVNLDGYLDFCRIVGNNREFFDCLLNESGKAFGREFYDFAK